MDEETKKLIVDNYALNKENNEMLKKLLFFQKLNQIYRIVYWAIIILSAIGLMYFVNQYLGNIMSLYTGGLGINNIGNMNDLTNMIGGDKNQIQDLLKSLNSN